MAHSCNGRPLALAARAMLQGGLVQMHYVT
jgi:hypothetical protein